MGKEDEIRLIAYRIWEESGRQDGHDWENWLKAEELWEKQNTPESDCSRCEESQF